MKKALERILLVDDDEDIRAIARLALESVGGLEVMLCAAAEEALAAICRFDPDLVLLDVEMPGTDGPATLALLRAEPSSARLPVIFITARGDDAQRFRSLGALEVIVKPFDPLTLARQLREIWDRAVEGAEP